MLVEINKENYSFPKNVAKINNCTIYSYIAFASNTSHKSDGMKFLTQPIYLNSLNMLPESLTTTTDLLAKSLGLWHPFFLRSKLIFSIQTIQPFVSLTFCLQ